jgi:hypothetical protein
VVPGQPNTISPCSFNRLPWAGGFELPGLCCSQAGDAVFQGNRDRAEYLSYLESAQERYGAVNHTYWERRSSLRRVTRNFEVVNCFGENFYTGRWWRIRKLKEGGMKNNWFKLLPSILVLILGLAVVSTRAAETIEVKAGEKKAAKETKQGEKAKRYYEVMWAADANLCEKVRSYADRGRFNYMPTDVDFGNVKWIQLDDPRRKAINVTLAGESRSKTVFRWYTTRRTGLEWDFSLDVFPHEISFADLAKDPASFARKQEWTFEPDYVDLYGLNGLKSPKPSPWCSKLGHFREDLGCEGQYAKWRFSFFDLIDIDGNIYITAATETYQSPNDINLPVVILVGRYIAPKETPSIFGDIGNMKQLEHCCYLIKTP